jgi:glutamate 5-kinase
VSVAQTPRLAEARRLVVKIGSALLVDRGSGACAPNGWRLAPTSRGSRRAGPM